MSVPETISKSACRGVARIASMPNRARSNLDIADAIISNTQQASPNATGHVAERRPQFRRPSTDVTTTFRAASSGTLIARLGKRLLGAPLQLLDGLALDAVDVPAGRRLPVGRAALGRIHGQADLPREERGRQRRSLLFRTGHYASPNASRAVGITERPRARKHSTRRGGGKSRR